MPTHLRGRNRFSQADKTSSNCSRLTSDSSAPASPVTSLCWISYRSAWFIATGWGWTVSRYSSWIQAAPMKWLKVTLRILTHKHTQMQKETSNLSCLKNEYRLYKTCVSSTQICRNLGGKTVELLPGLWPVIFSLFQTQLKASLVAFNGEKSHDRTEYQSLRLLPGNKINF